MATKTHPFGAKLQYDLDDVSTYTDFVDVKSIKPPNITIGASETTHLESANAFREFIPGWADGGEIGFSVYASKAQLNTIYTTLLRVTYYFKVLWPLLTSETNASNWKFQGHITSIDNVEFSTESDDPIMVDFTVKITGKPTWTSAT